MNLKTLFKMFSGNSCRKIYAKRLAPNDNSKNQVYFGGSFDVLNIFPTGTIQTDLSGSRKRESFKSKLNFYWLTDEGLLSHAPYSQLILYPDYPEVRFSGFLLGCKYAPSELMTSRKTNRLLFVGIDNTDNLVGYVADSESEVSKEFNTLQNLNSVGIFKEIILADDTSLINAKAKLLSELKRIHNLGWIDSKRLTPLKEIVPCAYNNCGGYTLEAELGVESNGIAKPDYLGWEIKQFGVRSFTQFGAKAITLMDHSPDNGYFADNGVEAFLVKYGYNDKRGRQGRINFGGIYKYNTSNKSTSMTLISVGFDVSEKKITDTNGYIALIDFAGNIAAAWSFKGLIEHWKTKHFQACYVPAIKRKGNVYNFSNQQYAFGNNIILGINTDVTFLLQQIALLNVYYDPALKLEPASGETKKILKTRSLFRIKSSNLSLLYEKNERINLLTI